LAAPIVNDAKSFSRNKLFAEKAIVVAFRQKPLLPLDDVLG
jgi:hypothetical protein